MESLPEDDNADVIVCSSQKSTIAESRSHSKPLIGLGSVDVSSELVARESEACPRADVGDDGDNL